MSNLYERILEQTEQLGITGKDLGSLLGLKKSPLTDWKNKKSSPTLEQLIKMCEIFSTSADYLLHGKTNTLSKDQRELLDKYKNLDRHGRHKVHSIIYEEMNRVTEHSDIESKNTR